MAKHLTYATFDELKTIDGIGDTEANNIIKYRVENPLSSWSTFQQLAPNVLFNEVARLHHQGVWKSHMSDFKSQMDFASKSANSMSNKCEDVKTQMEAVNEIFRKSNGELSQRIECYKKEVNDSLVKLDGKLTDRLNELSRKIDEHEVKMDQAFSHLYNYLDSKFERIFKMLGTSNIVADCGSVELGQPSSAPIAQPPPHRPPGASEADHGTPCPAPTLGAPAAKEREPLEDSAFPTASVPMISEASLMPCSPSTTSEFPREPLKSSELPKEPLKSLYRPPHLDATVSSLDSRHSRDKRHACPEPFGGRVGSIETWLHKFHVIARDFNWSREEKLRFLTASLAGRGIDTTQLFPEEVRNNYPSLCRALRRKYGTPLQDRRLRISSPYSCHGCGGKGHYVRDCPTRKNLSTSSVRCYECGGYGHISIYCGNHTQHQLNGPPWNSRSNSPDWRATMRPLNPWRDL